jgi:3'(2'), 5'-bisphosphate nucleotidase
MPSRTDAQLSRDIARDAGALLLSMRETHGNLDDWAVADRLRDRADRASHELLVAALAEARPQDEVLSEEGRRDDPARVGASRVWIVDPLDGTWEYGQGRPDFAVHVALWEGEQVLASTVDLPAQGLTRSVLDEGVAPAALPTDRPIRIVASRTRPPEVLAAAVALLSDRLASAGITTLGAEVVDVGSVGAKVNEVISGRAEAYVHDTGFYEWDVAAPYGVARHYGYDASHVDGSVVTFNHTPPYVNDFMVSHPSITELLITAMKDAS